MKATFTHVVVNLSKSYNPVDLVALESANQVLLVTQLDLPCLRNVVRLLMSFGQMKTIAEKVKIVVNRVGLEQGQITLRKARDTIGRDIYWQLPNDYRTMIEVRNNGVPLMEQAPKAPLRRRFASLPKPSPTTKRTHRQARARPPESASSSVFGRRRPESDSWLPQGRFHDASQCSLRDLPKRQPLAIFVNLLKDPVILGGPRVRQHPRGRFSASRLPGRRGARQLLGPQNDFNHAVLHDSRVTIQFDRPAADGPVQHDVHDSRPPRTIEPAVTKELAP